MSNPATLSASAVLVGGLAHTGKTQLRTVLNNAAGLEIFRETHLFRLDGTGFGNLSEPANLERCLQMLESHEPLPADRSGIIDAFRHGPIRFEALVALIYQWRATELGAERWGVQMGSLESRAAAVLELLPQARMVHLIRHPGRHLSERGGTNRLKKGLERSRWRESAELGLTLAATFPDRYRIVRTEDLAGDPHSTIADICDFLQIELPSAEMIRMVDWDQLLAYGTDGELDPDTAAIAQRLGFEHLRQATTVVARMGHLSGRLARHAGKPRKGRSLA